MIKSRKFGELPNGEIVTAYDFVSEAGFRATIISYGATLQALTLPDGIDVVLGFDFLKDYLGDHPYFGCAIGRVANRIKDGRFELDGETFELVKNDGPNNLHAGPEGFDRVNWFGEIEDETLILRHTSPDGYQGFPGELMTELRFKFTGHTLTLDIQAVTSKPCPVNITYHPYFNLTDGGASHCYNHELQIFADLFTVSDEHGAQTGEMRRNGCREHYRFIEAKRLLHHTQLDKNFVISEQEPPEERISKMAILQSLDTGHKVIICSTQLCLQAYAGSNIPEITGKSDINYGPNHGVALEPQGYPDAVNNQDYPSNILRPGNIYHHKINYTFKSGDAQA